ncbi:FAD-dependent oxidoreductase [Tepidiforma flava]|uniref:FAD-dependent oxidoreductase n=1 Tax=Tepidiforma flava TaxID=3004094 RepID=A0ABY7MB50_9CHLR|nr:FAD-dependent oxidoreductase [Tepidiforma flava]WBL37472.1 FAD-dependent oxidoreductase [Tepidiforma flava]
MERYDVIIVGGGIAGSGLATVLARAGRSVLVLERTEQFRDVVRGEWIAPWGVVEARRTGLYDVLAGVSQHHLPYHVEYGEGIDPGRRTRRSWTSGRSCRGCRGRSQSGTRTPARRCSMRPSRRARRPSAG